MDLIVLHGGEESRVEVRRGDGDFEVRVGNAVYRVDGAATHGAARSLLIDGRQFEVSVASLGDGRYRVSGLGASEEVTVLDPLSHLAEQASGGAGARGVELVRAYMPGRVVAVEVEEGQEVRAGQGLVVLEAMKMQNEIQAERDGTVRNVFVEAGQAVEGGDPLFEIG